MQKNESALFGWIRAAAADGRLNVADPSFAAGQFIALIKSDIFWPQLFAAYPAPSRAECQRIIASAVAMFLDHYATEDSSRR